MCTPAMALRDNAPGTITKSDDTEMVVVFGAREKNALDRSVMSGLCRMNFGVLRVGQDGDAIFKSEISSVNPADKWQGQFSLLDKDGQVMGTLPSVGTFTIAIRELSPRTVTTAIPLKFSPELFKKIHSIIMTMEC